MLVHACLVAHCYMYMHSCICGSNSSVCVCSGELCIMCLAGCHVNMFISLRIYMILLFST